MANRRYPTEEQRKAANKASRSKASKKWRDNNPEKVKEYSRNQWERIKESKLTNENGSIN